jgi:hypothetical protein
VGPLATLDVSEYKQSLGHADILRSASPYPTLSRLSYVGLMQKGRRHAVAQLVETLRYKPGGRGFDSQ